MEVEVTERWPGHRDAVDGLVGREDDVEMDAAATGLLRAFPADARALADTIDDLPRD